MIPDLVELVAMYNDGAWSREDLFTRLTLLVPQVPVQSVVEQLSEELREGFAIWLRATYDNDVPADDFVSIGRPRDPAQDHLRVAALREWLRANRTAEGAR